MSRLNLQTAGVPAITEPEAAATASPARGKAMVAALHKRLRPTYPLVHQWEFWHDRQGRKKSPSPERTSDDKPAAADDDDTKYEDRLVKLLDISDVKHFWELHNNFDVRTMLKLRDSVHLFKRGVRPLWEDPRNVHGGAWTFRVPRDQSPEFWMHTCLLAIGERLQEAVVEPGRTKFLDDICGVSYSVRFNSMLITIWNRDGDHEAGKQRILETVLREMPEHLAPKRPDMYYYKKHSSHAGFTAPVAAQDPAVEARVDEQVSKEAVPVVVEPEGEMDVDDGEEGLEKA